MTEQAMPSAPGDDAVVPWDLFLVYLGHFSNAGAADPLLWTALEALGLEHEDFFTGAEMRAVEQAIATLVQAGLDSSEDPKVQTYARLMRQVNGVLARHTAATALSH